MSCEAWWNDCSRAGSRYWVQRKEIMLGRKLLQLGAILMKINLTFLSSNIDSLATVNSLCCPKSLLWRLGGCEQDRHFFWIENSFSIVSIDVVVDSSLTEKYKVVIWPTLLCFSVACGSLVMVPWHSSLMIRTLYGPVEREYHLSLSSYINLHQYH